VPIGTDWGDRGVPALAIGERQPVRLDGVTAAKQWGANRAPSHHANSNNRLTRRNSNGD